MGWLWGLLLVLGVIPLLRAWSNSAGMSLRAALAWGWAAWASWCGAALLVWQGPAWATDLVRYLALCLTGCCGVCVLGARRPGVAAWNLVVAGLLAALLLPVAQQFGHVRLEGLALWFIAGVLFVGLTNYLPTRFFPVALSFGVGCAVELTSLVAPEIVSTRGLLGGRIVLALGPWWGMWGPRAGQQTGVNTLWLAFRNRYGFVWAQRTREQFNAAARNAGLSAEMGWSGLHRSTAGPVVEDKAEELLRALLKRFGLGGDV